MTIGAPCVPSEGGSDFRVSGSMLPLTHVGLGPG